MTYTAIYQQPVEAKLVVLVGGRQHDAGPEDLEEFGLVVPGEAYVRFEKWVEDKLAPYFGSDRRDITDTAVNPLRYAVECALHYPHMPDEDTARDLRRLQADADAVQKLLDRLSSMEQGTLPPAIQMQELRELLAPVLAANDEIESPAP